MELEKQLQDLIELREAIAVLHTHQNILHKLKDFENDCLENYYMESYDKGFLKGINKCIELITESMEESI